MENVDIDLPNLSKEELFGEVMRLRRANKELTAECYRLEQEGGWVRVPASLEYDLLTYAGKHGELPSGHHIVARSPTAQSGDTLKEDMGTCAAAVVLAYYRKTHDHILADTDALVAAQRIERYLGRR